MNPKIFELKILGLASQKRYVEMVVVKIFNSLLAIEAANVQCQILLDDDKEH